MGRFTGIVGLLAILGVAFLFSKKRRAIQPRVLIWGLGLQFGFAFLVLKTGFGELFQAATAAVNAMLGYAEAGSNFVFGPLGTKARAVRCRVRVSGSPHRHLHRFVFRHPLLPRRYAVGDSRDGHRDAEGDGRERRRVHQRRRQHLHGADGSAADHPAVPRQHDAIGTVHRDDERDGARLGRDNGGLRHGGQGGDQAPADRGDYDRARHHHAGQDADAGGR